MRLQSFLESRINSMFGKVEHNKFIEIHFKYVKFNFYVCKAKTTFEFNKDTNNLVFRTNNGISLNDIKYMVIHVIEHSNAKLEFTLENDEISTFIEKIKSSLYEPPLCLPDLHNSMNNSFKIDNNNLLSFNDINGYSKLNILKLKIMEQKDINFIPNNSERKSKLSLLTLFLMIVRMYINKCFNYISKMFSFQDESKDIINNECNNYYNDIENDDCHNSYNEGNDGILKEVIN